MALNFFGYGPILIVVWGGIALAQASPHTPFDEAVEQLAAPSVVIFGELRLPPFGSDAETVAASVAKRLDVENLRAYGLGTATDNICSLYGYELTENYRQMRDLVRGSHLLDYLSEQQYLAWQEGQTIWYTITRNFQDGSPEACKVMATEMPNMLEKVR